MRPRHFPAGEPRTARSWAGRLARKQRPDAHRNERMDRRGAGFSWLDLYLMGLATPDEVPDMFILHNLRTGGAAHSKKSGSANASAPSRRTRSIVTMEQVLAAMGRRNPPSRSGRARCSTRGSCTSCCPGRSPSRVATGARGLPRTGAGALASCHRRAWPAHGRSAGPLGIRRPAPAPPWCLYWRSPGPAFLPAVVLILPNVLAAPRAAVPAEAGVPSRRRQPGCWPTPHDRTFATGRRSAFQAVPPFLDRRSWAFPPEGISVTRTISGTPHDKVESAR